MKKSPRWLLEHKRDLHSQTGEDGVIEKILDTLPATDKWCVEFGAWDGLFLTNTRNLIESRDYSALLIEADRDKFDDLRRNYACRPNVLPINRFVGFGSEDSLDKILEGSAVPENFDLLSVDIDGNDYHAWKAMSRYRPKVVVIEFNPTIPTHIRFVQAADENLSQGSSLRSLVDLGKDKGYELVAVLPFNAFFVREEYYELFHLDSNDPELMRTNLDAITYLFTGFDGTVFLHGNRTLPWHGIEFSDRKAQQLPRALRAFPDHYSVLQKAMFVLFLLLTRPRQLITCVRSGFPWTS